MSDPRDRRAGVRRRMAKEGEHLLRVVGSRRRHTRPPLLRRAPPGAGPIPPAMPCGPPSCRPTERKPEMPTKPTRPHSVVVVKLPQSETVVVVCEDGSAAYLKWEDQTWGRLRPVPLTEADLAGTEPRPT